MGNDTAHGGAGDDWVGRRQGQRPACSATPAATSSGATSATTPATAATATTRSAAARATTASPAAPATTSSPATGATTPSPAAPGADTFHGSQDAGIDRVLDFNLAEGDRVQLDPGTTYTVSQVGADTVIDMGGGDQMILVGVQLASLARLDLRRLGDFPERRSGCDGRHIGCTSRHSSACTQGTHRSGAGPRRLPNRVLCCARLQQSLLPVSRPPTQFFAEQAEP